MSCRRTGTRYGECNNLDIAFTPVVKWFTVFNILHSKSKTQIMESILGVFGDTKARSLESS